MVWVAMPQSVEFDSGPLAGTIHDADGAVAKVVYVDPNMRIARVRTEDGRNITLRHKDLRRS